MAQQQRLKVDTFVQTVNSAYFTADTGADRVELIIPAEIDSKFNFPNNGQMKISDNFNILSIGFSLPFGFEFEKIVYEDKIFQNVELYYYTKNEKLPQNKHVFYNSFLPFSNYEYSINTYINWNEDMLKIKKELDENYLDIYARFKSYPDNEKIYISMLGVPTELNAKKIYVPIFMKIEHKALVV